MGDDLSLGAILVRLKIVSRADVDDALRLQENLSRDEKLGELLVARGLLEREQLVLALAAQRDLRSNDKATRAIAAARLAEMSSSRVVSISRAIRAESAACRRDSNVIGYSAVRTPTSVGESE